MIKSNRHDKPQQQSDLQMVQNPDHKKKNQDRYSTVGRDSAQYTVHMYTKDKICGHIFVWQNFTQF